MKIKRFSPKQKRVMSWWGPKSPDRRYDAIICDGAVRSGKTLCMGLSFVCWAMASFREQQFAFCGKSVVSLRRNLLQELTPTLKELGFRCREKRSENLLVISKGGRENRFYLMGGKDEGSAAVIQGVTLAGVLLDEAALMPRSFVEQAIARCSVQGSRLWFNCNPEGLNKPCNNHPDRYLRKKSRILLSGCTTIRSRHIRQNACLSARPSWAYSSSHPLVNICRSGATLGGWAG